MWSATRPETRWGAESKDSSGTNNRKLIAQKWDCSDRRGPGRPRIRDEIAQLMVHMAQEHPSWGYARAL